VEVGRRDGVSETTFNRWKAKFGGMAVSDARRLRRLEAENTRLKRFWRTRIWTTRRSRTCWQKTGNACGSAAGARPSARGAPLQ
jgi:putative transposase